MAPPTLYNNDFTLSDEQEHVREAFATLFERECPIERVRSSEPLGFDEKLWQQLLDAGVLTMGLPVEAGGDGAGLVELALVVEEQGYRLAPVPLVPAVVAARLLARTGDPQLLELGEHGLVTIALHPARSGERQLVPAGAVATTVVGLLDGELVVVRRDAPGASPGNIGDEPLAWVDLAEGASRVQLASGDDAGSEHEQAVREWRLLTAAFQVGLAHAALDLAVQYAKERVAFGVPIGTFQAVAHPLADVASAVQGARHLAWKAAWLADHDPERAAVEIEMAYLYACRTATLATATGVHTQGGFGFTLESDMQLYFRRAKSNALLAGDPSAGLSRIAELLYGLAGA